MEEKRSISKRVVLRGMALWLLLAASHGYAVAACAQDKKGGGIVYEAEYYVL